MNSACTHRKSDDPIQFFLVPAQDSKILEESGHRLQAWLENDLGRAVEVKVPVNYTAVIEAFGSRRADVAIMNSFGYVIARQKYQAEAKLVAVSKGQREYFGEIISRKDRIKNIKQLTGKKFGFVSPVSGSGYIAPIKFLKENKIEIKEHVFLGSHDAVVTAVYQGRVDAGATFYRPDENGLPNDARQLVKTQFPDVFDKLNRLALTGPLPNEPVVMRKDLPESTKRAVIQSIKKLIASSEGKKIFFELYHFDDLVETVDSNYDSLVQDLKVLGQDPEKLIQ